VTKPVSLPSPANARVDAHMVAQVQARGARTFRQLEDSLPADLVPAGSSKQRVTEASLSRLRLAGTFRLQNGKFDFAPGRRP
jgi:hypothetical protein